MKFYLALCDDDKDQTVILHQKIRLIVSAVNIDVEIDSYVSGIDLLEYLQKGNKYDVIFLDMQMPEIDGIETGKRIRAFDKDVIIVYITGFVDFAINAFEIRAFDYIIKPVDIKKLRITILEAFNRTEKYRRECRKTEQLLIINYNKKIVKIKMSDIIYIEKVENKVIIVCVGDKFEVYDSLSNIRRKLNEDIFLQPHQGYIVNKKKISRYENQQIILTDEYIIPVSKKNIKTIKRAFFESLR